MPGNRRRSSPIAGRRQTGRCRPRTSSASRPPIWPAGPLASHSSLVSSSNPAIASAVGQFHVAAECDSSINYRLMLSWVRRRMENMDQMCVKWFDKMSHTIECGLIKCSLIPPTMAHRHLVDFCLLAEHLQEGSGMGLRISLAYKFEPEPDAVDGFQSAMMTLLNQHRPSRMPFFRRLAQLPNAIASDPEFLGEVHL